MDRRFILQGITFIWEENKARENPRHHIELEEDAIRLISARKATRKEHDSYEA